MKTSQEKIKETAPKSEAIIFEELISLEKCDKIKHKIFEARNRFVARMRKTR
ncbi:MAG: hypothetical protein U9Q27_02400 [Patescibacteria group bacterium]|nr:hypothetical protein [Patescibacteria group bacterium]